MSRPLVDRVAAAVRSNPVRTWLYGSGVAVVGLLVVTGQLDRSTADALDVVLAAVLLVGGVEQARRRVTPWSGSDAGEDAGRPQKPAD